MSISSETKIRESDANGLLRAGFYWVQPKDMIGPLAIICFIVAGISGIIALTAVNDSYARSTGMAPMMVLVTVVIFALGAWLWQTRNKKAGVSFHRDGTIETPFGFPHYGSEKAVGGDHRNVTNIESYALMEDSFGVRLVFSSGDVVKVAQYLGERGGRKIAVQLSHALNEMRQASPGPAATGSITLAEQPTAVRPALID